MHFFEYYAFASCLMVCTPRQIWTETEKLTHPTVEAAVHSVQLLRSANINFIYRRWSVEEWT